MSTYLLEAEVKSSDNKALLPFFLQLSFKRRKKVDFALHKNHILMTENIWEIAASYMRLNGYI